jgi:hypothetical protein
MKAKLDLLTIASKIKERNLEDYVPLEMFWSPSDLANLALNHYAESILDRCETQIRSEAPEDFLIKASLCLLASVNSRQKWTTVDSEDEYQRIFVSMKQVLCWVMRNYPTDVIILSVG